MRLTNSTICAPMSLSRCPSHHIHCLVGNCRLRLWNLLPQLPEPTRMAAIGLVGRADGVRIGAQPAQRTLINVVSRVGSSQRKAHVAATPPQAALGNSHQLDATAPREPLPATEDAEIR